MIEPEPLLSIFEFRYSIGLGSDGAGGFSIFDFRISIGGEAGAGFDDEHEDEDVDDLSKAESSSGQAKKSSRAQSRGQSRLRLMQGRRRWMASSRAAALSGAAARSGVSRVLSKGSGRELEASAAATAS